MRAYLYYKSAIINKLTHFIRSMCLILHETYYEELIFLNID